MALEEEKLAKFVSSGVWKSSGQTGGGSPLYLNNLNAHLVDALPYVDPIYTDYETKVKELIEEEMEKIVAENDGNVPDYLDSIPPPKTPHLNDENSLTAKEMNRIAKGITFEKLDMTHYTTLIQPETNDVNEWKNAVEIARALVEHSNNATLNLELMIRFNQPAWLALLENFQHIENNLNSRMRETKAASEAMNKKRKLEQMQCGNDLRNLTREKAEYFEKNANIFAALTLLENEVFHLKSLCAERGILPDRYSYEEEDSVLANLI